MFKSQTKDKKRIDELEKENTELKKEIVKLQGIIDYLNNPNPYELSLSFQKQQIEAERYRQKFESDLRIKCGLGRSW